MASTHWKYIEVQSIMIVVFINLSSILYNDGIVLHSCISVNPVLKVEFLVLFLAIILQLQKIIS